MKKIRLEFSAQKRLTSPTAIQIVQGDNNVFAFVAVAAAPCFEGLTPYLRIKYKNSEGVEQDAFVACPPDGYIVSNGFTAYSDNLKVSLAMLNAGDDPVQAAYSNEIIFDVLARSCGCLGEPEEIETVITQVIKAGEFAQEKGEFAQSTADEIIRMRNDGEFNGKDGAPGKDGQQGEQGIPGVKGETGAQGAKGDTGETGQNGADGAQGLPGINGLGLLNYSTDEQDTGLKWINGKSIYQRSFTTTLGGENTFKDIVIHSDLDLTLRLEVFTYNGTYVIPIPNIGEAGGGASAGLPYSITMSLQRSNNALRIRNYSNRTGYTAHATVWYTKKGDN